MNGLQQQRSLLNVLGIFVLAFVAIVIVTTLMTFNANQNVAQACSFINSQPGWVCVTSAEEADIFLRDGSRAATGNWNIAGFQVNGASRYGTTNGGTLQNAGGTAVVAMSVGAVNVTTGALQVGGVPVVTETGTQTLTNKTLTDPAVNGSVTSTDTAADPNVARECQWNGADWKCYDGTNAVNVFHQLVSSGQCQGYVAANNAPAALKVAVAQGIVDYGAKYAVADGTDDYVTIQAVIDAVDGTTCLSEGEFEMGVAGALTIAVGDDGGGLRGAGKGGWEIPTQNNITVLDFSASTEDILISVPASGSRVWNVTVSDFGVKGNGTSTTGLYMAGGLIDLHNVLFDGFSNASGCIIREGASSAQELIRQNTFSNNAARNICIFSQTTGLVIEDNYFWNSTGQYIVLGDVTSAPHEAPMTVIVRNNLFDRLGGDDTSVGIQVDWCENCLIEQNTWAGQGADPAATVGIRIGSPTVSGMNLKTLAIRNNDFRCRANSAGAQGWNYGVSFTGNAYADAVIFEGNTYDRCKLAGVNNLLVNPTTGSNVWIYDLGNNANTVKTSDGTIAGSSSLYAVDGVAGGVIAPYTREAAISSLFTSSASGSETWTIIPRSSNTTTTPDAGNGGYNVTWRAQTTTTSIQAWTAKPSTLGNGISPVFTNASANNGRADDNAFFSLTSAGADTPGTWLALVKVTSDIAGAKTVAAKYDDQADNCEWFLDISGTETVRMFLYDDSASATCATFISKSSSTSITIGQWYLLAVTYNGDATADGINIYALSETAISTIGDTNGGAGVYASMDNTAAPVFIGAYLGPAGSMTAGCQCAIAYMGFFPGIEMSRAQILQAGYALMPYVGVQLGR